MGVLTAAVEAGRSLEAPLALSGLTFVLLQILAPLHTVVGANLGDRLAAWLYDQLTEACVTPPGIGHLEDSALTSDLTVARDFDTGMTGPPLALSMDFIASGLVWMVGGLASAALLAGFAWWAPLVLGGAWMATHWLLRESGVWRDRNTPEVRRAQRDADYALPAGGRPPGEQGTAPLWPGRLDDRSVRQRAHPAPRAPVPGDTAARAPGAREPTARARRQPAGRLGLGRGRRFGRAQPGAARRLRAVSARDVAHCLWRPQLGARRRRGAGGGRAPAGGRDGRGRRPPDGQPPGRPRAARIDSVRPRDVRLSRWPARAR